jgi:hypothetical protein
MERKILYLPVHPTDAKGEPMIYGDKPSAWYYEVIQMDEIVAAYHAAYYRTINAVVADLFQRLQLDERCWRHRPAQRIATRISSCRHPEHRLVVASAGTSLCPVAVKASACPQWRPVAHGLNKVR